MSKPSRQMQAESRPAQEPPTEESADLYAPTRRLRRSEGPELKPTPQELPGLEHALARAVEGLRTDQQPAGCWAYELEADCTIPAEYILMMHFMDEIDEDLQSKLAVYLREHQESDGGWPLYPGGGCDLSCSVKAYYALKLAGDSPDDAHMMKARALIASRGGAARANVFTRITLAMFGQMPWRGVPFMPVEIVLLPRWFPFHIRKVSYWSRTVMVPLLVLCSLKASARNPRGVGVAELFAVAPEVERQYFTLRSPISRAFFALDRMGRWLEPLIPRRVRSLALERAELWMLERLNNEGGLGAIFPAMVNAYEALTWLGYEPASPQRASARQALDDLLVEGDRSAYCQPCVSPVWDTALACLALQEVGGEDSDALAERGLAWLAERQLLDEPGDWREARPDLEGGGWPFQFRNDHYPDLDDTGAVAWAMAGSKADRYQHAVTRAAVWIRGMQCADGGFASFDVDNTWFYLNEVPFADHGALLDPPTADVSARCAIVLAHRAQASDSGYREALQACLTYLRAEQEAEGPWYGRWGTNYIYGTWSVLAAFEQVGVERADPAVRRAVAWLKRVQRDDGGWGEDNDTYLVPTLAGRGYASTAFHTAWALLALMAAGEAHCLEVRRGVRYLLGAQREDGLWANAVFTSPGFPRVFYLKYHGYDKYFPLWALARYRNELGGLVT